MEAWKLQCSKKRCHKNRLISEINVFKQKLGVLFILINWTFSPRYIGRKQTIAQRIKREARKYKKDQWSRNSEVEYIEIPKWNSADCSIKPAYFQSWIEIWVIDWE